MYRNTYGDLRLAVMHTDRGRIDAVALSFADHDTFRRREGQLHQSNMPDTFNITYARPGQPSWEGADTTGLREAIEKYASIWFPDAWATPARTRTASRTALKAAAPHAIRGGARTRWLCSPVSVLAQVLWCRHGECQLGMSGAVCTGAEGVGPWCYRAISPAAVSRKPQASK